MTPVPPGRDQFVEDLRRDEELSIVRGLGSLAFVRSQGRTLEKNSQEKVLQLLWDVRGELEAITSLEDFDMRHAAWVQRVIALLRTNRSGQLAYGQAQKTLNVFLKFYVDWASRPTAEKANQLRPWLHCPLDAVVMKALRAHDIETWRERLWKPHYAGRVQYQRVASMATINEPAYWAWQKWIRELSPEKPIMIDAVWSLRRPV